MRFCLALAVAGLLLVTASANADYTYDYGWEDGVHTICGSYGNLVDPTNVGGVQTGLSGDVAPGTWGTDGPHSGDRYLHVAEEPHSSTPQAYLAVVTDLLDGDIVYASYWGWDDLDGDGYNAEPALRIWGHYSLVDGENPCPGSYAGSAGEGNNNSGYSSGTLGGWQEISSDWTFDSDEGTRNSLVIEARLYSYDYTAESRTDYWIDDVHLEVPDHAVICCIPEPASLALLALGSLALLRRR